MAGNLSEVRGGSRARLPLPTGPHAVGSVLHTVVDERRPAHLCSDVPGRVLRLKLWYPAAAAPRAPAERIWAELRSDDQVPAVVRAVLACMRQRVSARPEAPFASAAAGSRVVLYNHGLISFAAENTSLAETLASHGFTVVAVQHAEQMRELQALGAGQSAADKRADAARTAALNKATGAAKAQLAVDYYAAAKNTNRIVLERAADTSFVLDRLPQLVQKIPAVGASAIATASAALVGFSVGGAVAGEVAKRDPRATCVVNLDGGLFGAPGEGAIAQPYLMMYSAANDGINDALLPAHARRATPPGTRHLNFHDVAALVPGLRLLGAVGATDARAVLGERNATVRAFLG